LFCAQYFIAEVSRYIPLLRRSTQQLLVLSEAEVWGIFIPEKLIVSKVDPKYLGKCKRKPQPGKDHFAPGGKAARGK